MKIVYINRETNILEEEKVAGKSYLQWLYQSPLGMGLLEIFVKKKLFTYFFGKLQDMPRSRKKIAPFIKEFNIDMKEYEKKAEEFTSFNDFFYRKINPSARPITQDIDKLASPADGRLLAFENINLDAVTQVKGNFYSLKELIGNHELAMEYDKGTYVAIRLCPLDYHRYHFPDSGIAEEAKEINGSYYSVNPIALNSKAKVYCQNKRQITVFHSDNFDDILLIEVGATCVGSIIQTYKANTSLTKGTEKGYFKFGGSTFLMFFKPNTITIDNDLIVNTEKGIETKIKMGEALGRTK